MQTCILYAAVHNPEYTMNAINQPLALDPMLQGGAMLLGTPVARVLIEWTDGRKMRIDLPEAATDEPEEISMTPTQRRIVEILKASPVWLTRRGIANAMDRESIGGKFAGYVADLISRGLIFEHDSDLTDDKNKPKHSQK